MRVCERGCLAQQGTCARGHFLGLLLQMALDGDDAALLDALGQDDPGAPYAVADALRSRAADVPELRREPAAGETNACACAGEAPA